MFDMTAHIRTYVPIVVTWIVSAMADAGIIIPDDLSVTMTATIAGVVAAVYYAAVRWVGKKVPWVEMFLGSRTTPTYNQPAG